MANQTDEIQLPLEGVENEHCALIVDKAIADVQGVDSHRIELNNHRAIFSGKDKNTFSAVVKAIRDRGYNVSTVNKTFPVMHMTCASCAVSVESILNSLPGVVKAAVNFATSTASVEFIPGMVHAEDFRKAIQGIGYDLLITEDGADEALIEEIQSKNLRKLKRKTYWSILLTIPIVVIGMFLMDLPFANEIMWVLSTPVLFWLGRDFYINAYKQVKHLSANMDTLVALSTGVAYSFSVFNTLFPEYWEHKGLQAHVYFEAATVIVSFILLGKLLEEKAKGNTSNAIKKLMGLQAKTVRIITDNGNEIQIPIENIAIGNKVVVKPGEQIAVDGTVLNGASYVDESMLSGEPIPVFKSENASVFAGTINQKGSFQFKAEKVGRETMLAQIIKMVQAAQGSKAPVQKLVDKIAAIFVPVVIIIAVVSFLAWNLLGGENAFTQGLLALVTVLIIACPCALGLATPTAIMVGVGKGAEKGILIKDAESLELTKNINVVILDKTGTITEGKPAVTGEHWLTDEIYLKQLLYSIENQSEHPLAAAIVAHLAGHNKITINKFESLTGNGVKAEIGNQVYYIGNKNLIDKYNIKIDTGIIEKSIQWENKAQTVIWFANSESVIAILAIADQVKATSAMAIQELLNSGVEVHMLTGDSETTAKSIAALTNISHYKSEVLPDQKAAYVKSLQAQNKVVAMVGDGINDSTALAQADVSIAMGKGSDIAMDVAKMTIISSDLAKIPEAIQLSKATVNTIRQNLFWAFIYNLVGIPIAAGILYPFTGFLLNPMLAGAAMALSSVSVVSNSLRLKYKN